jgi:pimeloyl-ACP methyl ester carboxylesterase
LAVHLQKVGIRSIMPWPRGSGQSTGDLEQVDFHNLAADALATIEAEAVTGPVLAAGHAYGCWIARTMAANRPGFVNGLILLAAAAGKWPPELSASINIAMSPNASRSERLAALRVAFFAPTSDPTPWLEGWYPTLANAQRDARKRTPEDSWWHSGTAPILDVIADQDPFRPPETRDFYERELGKRVTIKAVAGASHALPDEQPEETAKVISDWIDALELA